MSGNWYYVGEREMSQRNITSDDLNYTMNENTIESVRTRLFPDINLLTVIAKTNTCQL